jgi:imidazolonepropionase
MTRRVYKGFNALTMAGGRYGAIEDVALVVEDGRILWLGQTDGLDPADRAAAADLGGGWLTPGLIDCHTHIVYGGTRAREFEMRLEGRSYAEIAAAGGGIVSTVSATRAASADALFAAALPRLKQLQQDGVTTVEIKSGYGLDRETEMKMLRVARRLGEALPLTIRTTLLAAHAVPPEYRGRSDDYVDLVVQEILPAVAEARLADAVDAFCEGIAFSVAQVERVFERAQALGLPVKLHAEQLSHLGGASLAAKFGALSADHVEYVEEADVVAMAGAGTVAVLLPGAFLMMRETQKPPVALFRRHGVRMALASDSNPGTSPALSLRLMIPLGCTLFGLTPEEALAGVTIHAAEALGLARDYGSLEPGKRADFTLWGIAAPAELAYWLGGTLPMRRFRAGEEIPA